MELCQVKCGTGGAGVESCAEGTVKNSEIKTKALNTAVIQCFAMSHRYLSNIEDSMNEIVNTLLFD